MHYYIEGVDHTRSSNRSTARGLRSTNVSFSPASGHGDAGSFLGTVSATSPVGSYFIWCVATVRRHKATPTHASMHIHTLAESVPSARFMTLAGTLFSGGPEFFVQRYRFKYAPRRVRTYISAILLDKRKNNPAVL